MKRKGDQSSGNAAKKTKNDEGEVLHYTKSGQLDMRYASSKRYLTSLARNASLDPTAAAMYARGQSLPPVYNRDRKVWESAAAVVQPRKTIGKVGPQDVNAAAGGANQGNAPAPGVANDNPVQMTEDGEILHYKKNGELDMRYSSSKKYMERMRASFVVQRPNEEDAVANPKRGDSLPALNLVSTPDGLVQGEITAVADPIPEPAVSIEPSEEPKAEVPVTAPLILKEEIPSNIPLTKSNIPNMKMKMAREWVEEQARKHAEMKMPILPSWIPLQKDGSIDEQKIIVQLYFKAKQQHSISLPMFDSDRRANYYLKKFNDKKSNFYNCLMKIREESVDDVPCILLNNTEICEAHNSQGQDSASDLKKSYGGSSKGSNGSSDDVFDVPQYIPVLDYETLRCTIGKKKKNKIGNGAFGIVYKGWHRGEEVAIKKLFMDPISSGDKNSFIKELTILASFGDHPNLVKLHGYTQDPCTIVMEFVTHGSLHNLLYYNQDDMIEAMLCEGRMKKRIVQGIAYGMRQLHSVGIIHADLKPANVLITKDFTAKITDFGLARLRVKTTSLIGSHMQDDGENVVAGTAAYMAPELLDFRNKVDTATDIYAFGILLNEIIHEEEPYSHKYEEFRGRGTFAAAQYAKTGHRPRVNTRLVRDSLFMLIVMCWNFQPERRPNFDFVSEELRKRNLVFPSLIKIDVTE